MRLHTGAVSTPYESLHWKLTLRKKKKKNPLPHRGLEPVSVLRQAFQSNALPAELSPLHFGDVISGPEPLTRPCCGVPRSVEIKAPSAENPGLLENPLFNLESAKAVIWLCVLRLLPGTVSNFCLPASLNFIRLLATQSSIHVAGLIGE